MMGQVRISRAEARKLHERGISVWLGEEGSEGRELMGIGSFEILTDEFWRMNCKGKRVRYYKSVKVG